MFRQISYNFQYYYYSIDLKRINNKKKKKEKKNEFFKTRIIKKLNKYFNSRLQIIRLVLTIYNIKFKIILIIILTIR